MNFSLPPENRPMLIKAFVIIILLLILASLGSGLVFMIRGGGHNSRRMVKALTLRIGLSVGLFFLLLLAYATGLINPHGL
jgi:Protein of unknown function (DUF2909)